MDRATIEDIVSFTLDWVKAKPNKKAAQDCNIYTNWIVNSPHVEDMATVIKYQAELIKELEQQ